MVGGGHVDRYYKDRGLGLLLPLKMELGLSQGVRLWYRGGEDLFLLLGQGMPNWRGTIHKYAGITTGEGAC